MVTHIVGPVLKSCSFPAVYTPSGNNHLELGSGGGKPGISIYTVFQQSQCEVSEFHCPVLSLYEDYSELGELSPRSLVCEDGASRTVKEERKRTSKELRELWHKAILQQILLLRMEKENQKLQGKYIITSSVIYCC